ncbi:hypothetical protein TSAR_009240 [Trichomalopsis sarcophagae]|uniref:BTB domain-containing protein n=1 Tax=Trichomalopsis sarcophagae TaxID=543379 RepID=A0A232F845_9HYME|nr:hypothetical protein TSAR_009240 [Trichomalopsis sarcophagae]
MLDIRGSNCELRCGGSGDLCESHGLVSKLQQLQTNNRSQFEQLGSDLNFGTVAVADRCLMAAKKNSIIPALLILILFSWRVNGVTYSETWSVTQFEVLNLKYAWMINNFKSITLNDLSDSIYSPEFWPSGNEDFKWRLKLSPESSEDSTYMSLFLSHVNYDTVHVNYTLSIGSVKGETSYTFEGFNGLGWETFIERNKAFNSCQPNGTLIINCEIHAISSIIETSGMDTDHYASIKNQTFEKKLSDELVSLLDDEKYSDVTITIEDNEIEAHKLILAARSPVFASLLMENDTGNNNENSSSIEITDVKPKVFRMLLRYIYTDKIDGVDSDVAKDLLVAAIKYDVEGLRETCEEILYNSINVGNAIEILDIADQYNITELKSKASKFVAKNAPNVIQSTGYKSLERSKPSLMYQAFRTLVQEYRLGHGGLTVVEYKIVIPMEISCKIWLTRIKQ